MELELPGWLPRSRAMALLAGILACQQCQEGQTRPQTRPRWPFPSARRVCPDSCRARAAARCCRCYFLLVFLDIDTSSLHPQDGFQASILFPMATKTQPGNLNPLAQLSGRGGRWGKLQAPPGWSLQLHTKLLESKTLVTITKRARYRCGSPGCKVPRSVTRPQVSRGTPEGWDLKKSLLHLHPSPVGAGSSWILGWILLDTGQEHWTDPACSSPAPTASQGCCSMHTLLLKYPICSSGKGQSKEWMLKRKRGGRMREQTNHISSNQSRPRK